MAEQKQLENDKSLKQNEESNNNEDEKMLKDPQKLSEKDWKQRVRKTYNE